MRHSRVWGFPANSLISPYQSFISSALEAEEVIPGASEQRRMKTTYDLYILIQGTYIYIVSLIKQPHTYRTFYECYLASIHIMLIKRRDTKIYVYFALSTSAS